MASARFRTIFGEQCHFIKRGEGLLPLGLKSKEFHEIDSALSFIRSLNASSSDWRALLRKLDESTFSDSVFSVESSFAQKLLSGQIRAFVVPAASGVNSGAANSSFETKHGISYQIRPSHDLLSIDKPKLKSLRSAAEAEKFIDTLGINEAELEALAKSLGIQGSAQSTSSSFGGTQSELKKNVAKTIAEENAVVLEKRNTAAPPVSESGNSIAQSELEYLPGNRPASLGPGPDNFVENVSEIVCGICTVESFQVLCGHGRAPGPNNLLEVVAEPTKTTTSSLEMFGVKVSVAKKFGGKEELQHSLALKGNQKSDCFKITDSCGNVIEKPSCTEFIEYAEEMSGKWLLDSSPKLFSATGNGCSGLAQNVNIHIYPSETYSVKGELQIFKDWVKEVNKGWEDWGKKIFNLSPLELKPEIKGPVGSFEASWGWKENSDWRAYYDLSLNFGLSPVLGVGIAVKASMAKIGLTALGMPPVIAEFAAEHLADIFLTVGASCQGSLTGNPHYKFYSDGVDEATGEAKLSVEGGVSLLVAARAGSDYIVSCQAELEATCKVTGEDLVDINRKGVKLQTTIKLDPFVGAVRLTTKVFKIKSKTREKVWKPWDAIELYKSKPRQLL